MSDLINRQDLRLMTVEEGIGHTIEYAQGWKACIDWIKTLPSAEPEKTVYIPDTKAIPTARSCVDLAEKVTATFYNEENEEWTQHTVTIADVLDSVCDDYTILPSAQPEIIHCKDCKNWDTKWNNEWLKNRHYCPLIDGTRNGDWYCADAERRTE